MAGSPDPLSRSSALDPRSFAPTGSLGQALERHVRYLASPDLAGRKPGTAGNRAAADYLVAQFQEAGLAALPSLPPYRQPLASGLGDNILGVRYASGAGPHRWIVLAAHFDHLGGHYLGADDNASAVAILLETARALPPLASHHVLFASFNAEEPPYIRTPDMGSRYFVDHLLPEIGTPANVQAALIMDLMGGVHWAPLAQTIFVAGAEASPELYDRVKDSAPPSDSTLSVRPIGMHLIEELPLVGQTAFSDYDAFRNASVPYVFLSSGRTPRYHQPTDVPDTLHYERMAATVEWLRVLLVSLDEDRAPYGFDPHRREFADELAAFAPLIRLAAEWDTRIPGTSLVSLVKLKRDAAWLETVNPAAPTPEDIARLERVSLRMQCLLTDLPGCFLL